MRREHPIYQTVFGFCLSIIGLIALLFFGTFSHLTCQREVGSGTVDCDLQAKLFGLLPLSVKKGVHDVNHAKVELSCFTDSGSLVTECVENSLAIVGSDGVLRISPHYLNASTAAETMHEINDFIHSSENNLMLRNQNWANVILGLLFVFVPFTVLGGLIFAISVDRL